MKINLMTLGLFLIYFSEWEINAHEWTDYPLTFPTLLQFSSVKEAKISPNYIISPPLEQ